MNQERVRHGAVDISLKMMQYFKKVAETKHITNASKELYIPRPQLTQTLLQLDLESAVDISAKVHEVDDWMIRLCRNCQETGVILHSEPAEVIAPLSVSAAFHVNYEWARQNGSFSLRERARRTAETVLNVAPEYRWPLEAQR